MHIIFCCHLLKTFLNKKNGKLTKGMILCIESTKTFCDRHSFGRSVTKTPKNYFILSLTMHGQRQCGNCC